MLATKQKRFTKIELESKVNDLIHERLRYIKEYFHQIETGKMPSCDTTEDEYDAYKQEKEILDELTERSKITVEN